MDYPSTRTFGDGNTPLHAHAPEDSRDRLDREQLREVAPGLRAPADPDERTAAFDPATDPDQARERRARRDGWMPDRRARFCELIGDGQTVDAACYLLGMSTAGAYALKRRPDGASFALAWEAANLIARGRIADRMLARALDGQVDRVVKPNGDLVERHRFDNRLALHMLSRLDRRAEAEGPDSHAARLVAQDFDGFLDLVRRDAAPARAGLFLLHAGQTDATDLAPIAALARADAFLRAAPEDADAPTLDDLEADRRHEWTAEQWRRAETAGLVSFARPPAPDEPESDGPESDGEVEVPETAYEAQLRQLREQLGGPEDIQPVWWDDDDEAWRTKFPPPDDFVGYESNIPGHVDYVRALTDAETALMGAGPDWYDDEELAELAAERDRWFAAAAAEAGAASAAGVSPNAGAMSPDSAAGVPDRCAGVSPDRETDVPPGGLPVAPARAAS